MLALLALRPGRKTGGAGRALHSFSTDKRLPPEVGLFGVNERKMANALTEGDYSRQVGQCLQIQSTWTYNRLTGNYYLNSSQARLMLRLAQLVLGRGKTSQRTIAQFYGGGGTA
jgi:hypothetical protein